jgi:hypothetical protein
MGVYNRFVVPRLVESAMRQKHLGPFRQRVAGGGARPHARAPMLTRRRPGHSSEALASTRVRYFGDSLFVSAVRRPRQANVVAVRTSVYAYVLRS